MSMKFPEHGYIEEDDTNLYYWKASTLWKLAETMLVEQVPLDSFDWTNDNFQFEPPEQPFLWRHIGDEAKRILNADLSYPIIISADGDIMDGMHRVLKCYVFGLPTVNAVRFTETPPPDQVIPRVHHAKNATHQARIRRFLSNLFQVYLSSKSGGEVFEDPMVMKSHPDSRARQPDIQVILADRLDIVSETRVDGPADLVVEVLSPGSEEVDRGAKYLEYEAGGVREYWIIDPLRNEALFYVRDDAGLFRNHPAVDGLYASHVLDRLTLDVSTLWQETLPDIRATTAMVDAMLA